MICFENSSAIPRSFIRPSTVPSKVALSGVPAPSWCYALSNKHVERKLWCKLVCPDIGTTMRNQYVCSYEANEGFMICNSLKLVADSVFELFKICVLYFFLFKMYYRISWYTCTCHLNDRSKRILCSRIVKNIRKGSNLK
jgi:hypothetical protein